MTALTVAPAMSTVLAFPGFEGAGPLVDTGNGVGRWNPFSDGSPGNGFFVSSIAPRSGNESLRLELANGNGFAGVFQDVPVTAGGEITFSGWNSLQNGVTGGSEIRIEFRDSVGNVEISRTGNLVPADLNSPTYTEFSLTDTVPAGADTARVVYAIQSFGAGTPQVIHVDDTAVSGSGVIPEPTGSVLAALGFFGLAMRRRR